MPKTRKNSKGDDRNLDKAVLRNQKEDTKNNVGDVRATLSDKVAVEKRDSVESKKGNTKQFKKDSTVQDQSVLKKEPMTLKKADLLLKPEVLFGNLSDSSKLKNDTSTFIVSKLNQTLQTEILDSIGPVSDGMTKTLQMTVAKIDYQDVKDSRLPVVVGNVLEEIKSGNEELTKEVSEIQTRLAKTPLKKISVSNLLYLDVPLNKNPIFSRDIAQAKTLEYAKLAKLTDSSAKKLADKNLYLDSADESVLTSLVKDGIITNIQKKDLQLTIALGNLTGDNISLMKALKTNDRKSIIDFVSWDKENWKQVITRETKSLPPGETIDSYAENMVFNIERTYPSQFILGRLVNPQQLQSKAFDSLTSLDEVLKDNDKLIVGKQPNGTIKWERIGAESREALKKDLQDLTAFANTYQHLDFANIINDKVLNLDQKKKSISDSIKLLDTFYKNNPELDLRTTNFLEQNDDTQNRNGKMDWKGIPDAESQKRIKNHNLTCQRLMNIAGPSECLILLGKGYDSAMNITNRTEDEFLQSVQSLQSGLEKGKARMIFAKAQQRSLLTAHNFGAIQDAVTGGFSSIAMANIHPTLINDLQRIDGFSDLFGSQDYCECEECRSILSPAAYFVDLMKFIEINISNRFFAGDQQDDPLYLYIRRKDLWELNLTCENTNTLIPYLIIVNKVLEKYLNEKVLGNRGNIFERLSRDSEKISFALPFNLPLEELRVYLSHFETSLDERYTLYQIYKTIREPDAKIWRAKLNLSIEEYNIFLSHGVTNAVLRRFGNAASVDEIKDVQEFIRRTGLNREQLDDLFSVVGSVFGFYPDLHNVTIDQRSQPDELQNFTEVLNYLTTERLDFIHRFIRLWKKTPSWTITEIDMVLRALKEGNLATQGQIHEDTVQYVAQMVDIQQILNLTVEQLCSMIGNIPKSDSFPNPPPLEKDKRLFERLFDARKLFGEDPVTHIISRSNTFSNTFPNDPDPKTPLLLGGLTISEKEFMLLFDLFSNQPNLLLDENGKYKLDVEIISLYYRHAKLAKSLNLSVEEFVQILLLIFTEPQPHPNIVVTTLEQIRKLKEFTDWLKTSPFSVSELSFILRGEESDTVKYKTTNATVTSIVTQVQQSQIPVKVTALKDCLSRTFNLTANQLQQILMWIRTDINDNAIVTALTPPSSTAPLFDFVKEMERKVSLLINDLKFKEETIKNITEQNRGPGLLGIADLKNLTINDIKALTLYKEFADLSEDAESLLHTVLLGLSHMNGISDETLELRLSDIFKEDKGMIHSLRVSSLNYRDLSPIKVVEYFRKCLDLFRTIGIKASFLQQLANEADFNTLSLARDIALGAFTSKYEDEKIRKEKLEPYQDKINVIKRDALCNYIIDHEKELKFKNLHDIYSFFLLDVEMNGCARTSRLVCGISSLQLYVHRCLVNLERSATDDSIRIFLRPTAMKEWEWRKNFRVWQANRKVFLYPENYILPELRDNKSPIFKELEDELLQEKITKGSAEAAYKKYVSEFAELARLRIAGSYYYSDPDSGTHTNAGYYFFGRTQQDPPQYYYRKWIDDTVWTPWEKIDLSINAPYVSAVVYLGRLYIFWVDVVTRDSTTVRQGESTFQFFENKINLVYSFVDENGKWIAQQKVERLYLERIPSDGITLSERGARITQTTFEQSKQYKKVYPTVVGDSTKLIQLDYFRTYLAVTDVGDVPWPFSLVIHIPDVFPLREDITPSTKILNMFNNRLENGQEGAPNPPAGTNIIGILPDINSNTGSLAIRRDFRSLERPFEPYFDHWLDNTSPPPPQPGDTIIPISSSFPYTSGLTNLVSELRPAAERSDMQYLLDIVHNRYPELVFTLNDQQFLIKYLEDSNSNPSRKLVRLTTSLANTLGGILFSKGLTDFLSLDTQGSSEAPIGITVTPGYESELSLTSDVDLGHIDLDGAYGAYYHEIFFHIPFLIAHNLSANQKFEEAKWWYERIFDPTFLELQEPSPPTDRNWRYIEFRNLTIQRLREILRPNHAAISIYENDPFNPHAIARLRLSAYQKAIVMKYLDNLLDWGDYLFAQDSTESINEATMLYVLASDILGKRPAKLGKCKTSDERQLTYEVIGPRISEDSPFLIILENLISINYVISTSEIHANAIAGSRPAAGLVAAVGNGNSTTSPMNPGNVVSGNFGIIGNMKHEYNIKSYNVVTKERQNYLKSVKEWEDSSAYDLHMPIRTYVSQFVRQRCALPSPLAFCVPNNDILLKYWDRVEESLFKIHNCMNISGIRRQLALFQPPINPMALVRARAEGLSLEDITQLLQQQPLPYRFTYLIEKARQFTQTLQSFGSALLSALEKKDVEELTLLRSLHERNILQLTKKVKEQQKQEAQNQLQAMMESKTNVQNRIDYYQGLINDGLTGWEIIQQISSHTASILRGGEAAFWTVAAILYLIPQVGSPFAMTYGGRQLGPSASAFAFGVENAAKLAESLASSMGLEANFQRRSQEWKQQLIVAKQELKQVDKQILAADLRQQIAQKDIEIHEKNIEQAKELDDFYRDKFTKLGLYNYLSINLNRLYHGAYNIAFEMAAKAELAYMFERHDDTALFIARDNWEADHAGLLAGERLLLQLQNMEKAYLEQNKRDYEVSQSFSLALLDPRALVTLRQTGRCDFEIPEIMFDLLYPGQYNRLIKSVRVSIPCVTGPYTNISARLTLVSSKLRNQANADPPEPIWQAYTRMPNAITMSTAQNDSGMFELNFRDERYLPFEGAGAISRWKLELPSNLRSFDYDTISDLIMHISYTAKDDDHFRTRVENGIVASLSEIASSPSEGLYRVLSLKHEFPNALYRLLHPSAADVAQTTEFNLERKHFPYFLNDKNLVLSSVKVYLKSKDKQPINTANLILKINNEPVGHWTDFPPVNIPPANISTRIMKESVVQLASDPIRNWTIDAGVNGLNSEKLDDILILLRYTTHIEH